MAAINLNPSATTAVSFYDTAVVLQADSGDININDEPNIFIDSISRVFDDDISQLLNLRGPVLSLPVSMVGSGAGSPRPAYGQLYPRGY